MRTPDADRQERMLGTTLNAGGWDGTMRRGFTAVHRNEIDASDVRAVRRHIRVMPHRDPVTIGGPVECASDTQSRSPSARYRQGARRHEGCCGRSRLE